MTTPHTEGSTPDPRITSLTPKDIYCQACGANEGDDCMTPRGEPARDFHLSRRYDFAAYRKASEEPQR